ncbi:MAG: DNA topoisomerase III [Verrucomicrobia bacterium]|nr:DNA topoisomerase III [Verrucomicrobiota bacterium]
MSKTLVIAEKPSVAADLNKALGGKGAKAEFFEVGDYIITSAVGHLAELCLPNSMTKGKGISWKLSSLPIIPDHFELKPIPRSAERLSLVKKLLKRADVTAVINACDAGREGELIFHNIMQISGVKKPVQRLWLQSMTQDSIRAGFAALRPAKEMEDLAAAAICRAESDWLVGINSTRALTAVNSGDRGFQLTPVGRVQTPTLAILSEREERIRNFVPKTYYEVHATFEVQAGNYAGRWFHPNFKKGEEEDAKAERIWDEERALAIVDRCQGQLGIVEEQKKATTQAAPLLYDLTSLQREANSRFGFSAKRTLQLAQRLYEHHKVLTYPRTDSRYLPEDNVGIVRKALEGLEGGLEKHVALLFEKGWFVKTGKVFNNAKVSDHHAIIPTGASIEKLDEAEMKLYQMVAQRLVAIFYPAARFDVTTRITRVAEEHFKSEGKILTDPGWLAVYGKKLENEDDDKILVPIAVVSGKNEEARTVEVEAREAQTRPPARFTEATLLSAMEGAGKLVEDEELREAMSQRGLGTPATRAAIIEGLLLDGYVAREGRELAATSKGMALINLLHHIGIAALTSPEMTGEWEFKLKGIEQHQVQREKFMEEICRFTREIVEKAKGFQDDDGSFPDLEVVCPKCGKGPFAENVRQFKCRECGWSLWKSLASRPLEREEIKELLEKKKVGPLEGFRSRFGKSFAAMLLLDEELKPKFSFSEEGNEEAAAQLQQAEAIASCPLCKTGMIREGMNAFVCDQTLTKKCSFRMGKTILQQPITREQVVKLAEGGKTDFLSGFVSKKGRKFSALLKLEGGKVSFEFAPRAAGKKVAKSKTGKNLKQVIPKEKKTKA